MKHVARQPCPLGRAGAVRLRRGSEDLPGLGRGEPDLRRAGRNGARRDPVRARRGAHRQGLASVHRRRGSATRRPQDERGAGRKRAASLRSGEALVADPYRHPESLRRRRIRAARRASAPQQRADPADAAQVGKPGHRHRAAGLFPAGRNGAGRATGAVDYPAGKPETAVLRPASRAAADRLWRARQSKLRRLRRTTSSRG